MGWNLMVLQLSSLPAAAATYICWKSWESPKKCLKIVNTKPQRILILANLVIDAKVIRGGKYKIIGQQMKKALKLLSVKNFKAFIFSRAGWTSLYVNTRFKGIASF